ncbi:MAG: sulfite exporter TauE/SafE family protein [Deltaproteobacteria bacterium]|nr:MAG: sulfite exporter TauE/SafE family protein [Deltaproteobacteria bacterium]
MVVKPGNFNLLTMASNGNLMESNFLWLACFVWLSYTTQATTGFGSTIIAVTLGAILYPIQFLLPILVPLDIVVNAFVVIRHQRYVDRQILFKTIIPIMGIGLFIGIAAFNILHGRLLKKLFGLLVVGLSVRELQRLLKNKPPQFATSKFISRLYIFSAGIIQGIYASGGPLLVYAMNRLNLPKSIFRSTISALWLIANIILTASYIVADKMNWVSLKYFGLLLPVIIIGIIAGEKLHAVINEHAFKIIVFVLLLGAGFPIIFT